jgi:glycosyltransferase involved in cell wall biosynthesis
MPIAGPWGGGNKTITALVDRLRAMGHTVAGEPRDDIDVIFCVDPRTSERGISYQDLHDFAASKRIPIIQRVGDVGTHGKPDLTQLVKMTVRFSSRVIYTSEWARDFVGCQRDSLVIPNGALPVFFQGREAVQKDNRGLTSVVTHHWSNNPMKGIDLYERLHCETREGKLPFMFTYIGRSSPDLTECTIPPTDTDQLARMLPNHDVYLTASRYEAGANHILEAMACGLPVVYSTEGGSIPEYCGQRGIGFKTYEEMVDAVALSIQKNSEQRALSRTYTRTIDDVVDEYLEVLCEK